MDPLVSIIIPTFNRLDLLPRAVRSAMAQTYKQIEILVVDDSADHNAGSVVRALTAEDPRVTYLTNPFTGRSAARNFAIRNARGDYIAFLDDDDEWLPEKLSKQIAYMTRHSISVCFCGARLYRASGRVLHHIPKFSGWVSQLILAYNPYPAGSVLVVKTTALDHHQLFDESLDLAEDWDLLIRLARGHKFGVLKEELANIYQLNTSLRAADSLTRGQDMVDARYRDWISWRVHLYRALRRLMFTMARLRPS